MHRTIEKDLSSWKTSDHRKPLLVRGARQVGKSYAIEQFGRESFENSVTIDLEKLQRARRVFEGDLDAARILADLEVIMSCRIQPGRTLLFLDEVQACPRAMTALRYLHEDRPDLHVIAAGSLLELAMGDTSFPVGRIQILEMHPLSFPEFMQAMGNDQAVENLLGSPKRLSAAMHESLLESLKAYCLVGGMPESVADYAEHRSLRRCAEILDDLRETLRQDFPKYAQRANTGCLEAVFDNTPRLVGDPFMYSRLTDQYEGQVVKRAFELLQRARLVTEVRASMATGLPLGAGIHGRRFKAIMLDVGIWQRLCGLRADRDLAGHDLLDVHRGAMAEQLVGQEMLAARGGDLYFWSRQAAGSQAEIDYLAEVAGDIYGVEVKSGVSGRLRSLHLFLAEHPQVKGGLVFSSRPYEELPDQRLTFLPVYFAYSAFRSSEGRVP